MPRRKRPESIRYSVRLSHAQAERLATLRQQLHARSDNEVFDYLVTVGTNQRDDLEQLVYSLFGNLADSLAHRFQSLETVSQLHLALTDTYIKYALTALPEVPSSLLAAARIRATRIYEQVNLTAAREFQRRRQSDAYNPAQLGIEDEPGYSPLRRVRSKVTMPRHRRMRALDQPRPGRVRPTNISPHRVTAHLVSRSSLRSSRAGIQPPPFSARQPT